MDSRVILPFLAYAAGTGLVGLYFGWLLGFGLMLMGVGVFSVLGMLLPPEPTFIEPGMTREGPAWGE